MTNDTNSTKLTVLHWLNNQITPVQALYRLLTDEWDIPRELVNEALGHEDGRLTLLDAMKTEAEPLPTPLNQATASTYYCEEHNFSTENPQSWAAHHTHADHRDEDRSNDENEGLGALFE